MDAYQIKGYRIVVDTDDHDIATQIYDFASSAKSDLDCKCEVTLDRDFPISGDNPQTVSAEKYRQLQEYFYEVCSVCEELDVYEHQELDEYVFEAKDWVKANEI